MSEPSHAAAAGPDRPKFSAVVTVVCSIVVALYVGLLARPLVEPPGWRLVEIDRPAASLERLVTRELDLRAAMRDGVGWEWRLYQALSGDEDPLAQAAGWYEELLDVKSSPRAELYHAVLLAESGRADDAGDEVASWEASGEPARRNARWVAAAYLEPPPGPDAGRALLAEIAGHQPANWFTDTLTRRIAARAGDEEAAAHAEASIVARGHALLVRARLLMALSVVVFLLGVAALVWIVVRRRGARVADAALPPIWSGAEGYALFVRGLGVPQAIALAAFVVLRAETGLGSAVGMVSDLPLFMWVMGYLHARNSSLHEAFGLRPRRRAALAGAALALIAAALFVDAVVVLASSHLDITTHWTDGFAEELLWGSRRRVILDAFDASVWAPIVEEIIFRGLLYGTLRTRLAVWPSALVSAVIFTVPHGYAIAGSASVLASGILWAIAYERTRSLLPGLIAHFANNALSTIWTLAMLR
jgi:membrane protease YdiL (CAAX protease family)